MAGASFIKDDKPQLRRICALHLKPKVNKEITFDMQLTHVYNWIIWLSGRIHFCECMHSRTQYPFNITTNQNNTQLSFCISLKLSLVLCIFDLCFYFLAIGLLLVFAYLPGVNRIALHFRCAVYLNKVYRGMCDTSKQPTISCCLRDRPAYMWNWGEPFTCTETMKRLSGVLKLYWARGYVWQMGWMAERKVKILSDCTKHSSTEWKNKKLLFLKVIKFY